MITTMTRGDRKPDATITLSDARNDANFSTLALDKITVIGERNGSVVFSGHPASIAPSQDGKSAVIVRPWQVGDTDVSGRMYITVVVQWPDGTEQTFPNDSPLSLDIRRKPGDD